MDGNGICVMGNLVEKIEGRASSVVIGTSVDGMEIRAVDEEVLAGDRVEVLGLDDV